MASKQVTQLLTRIFATDEGEISCSHLQSLLPIYLELEIADKAPDDLFSQVRNHLLQCPDCKDEYSVLNEVIALEALDLLPEVEQILAQFEETELEEGELLVAK